jgi:hypothetical protein
MEVKNHYYKIDTSAYHFQIFREDVIDRFICIYKCIQKYEIPISFNYMTLLNEILIDFRLNNIITMINSLVNEPAIRNYVDIYETTIKYCNEIMENDIIKATMVNMKDLKKYNEKEKEKMD